MHLRTLNFEIVTMLAKHGWLVEVQLISDGQPDPRFFAVGRHEVREAEEAILSYPGIIQEDSRHARRRLSDLEITHLKLRDGGVRPYILDATVGQVVRASSNRK